MRADHTGLESPNNLQMKEKTAKPKPDEWDICTGRPKGRKKLLQSGQLCPSEEPCYPSLETSSTSERLWRDFADVRYKWLQKSEIRPPNLLFHARLYTFAEERLVESLAVCCLHHLHYELRSFELGIDNGNDVLRLLHFAFTYRSRISFSGEDRLRKLVVHYAASKIETLLMLKGFRLLLDKYGELGWDLVQRLFS